MIPTTKTPRLLIAHFLRNGLSSFSFIRIDQVASSNVGRVYRKKTPIMTRKIFPSSSLASEAVELVRFRNISTAITDSPKR